MSEENIIEVRLSEDQRIAFAAVLRAAHLPGTKHQAAIFSILTDSFIPADQSSTLRLQVAMVDWKTGEKVAAILREKALPTQESQHFT